MLMLIFLYLEFMKLIIGDKRPDTCKIIFFVGFRDPSLIKLATFNKGLQ